jgi:hypothetical protein
MTLIPCIHTGQAGFQEGRITRLTVSVQLRRQLVDLHNKAMVHDTKPMVNTRIQPPVPQGRSAAIILNSSNQD